jgi:hypothetical protein
MLDISVAGLGRSLVSLKMDSPQEYQTDGVCAEQDGTTRLLASGEEQGKPAPGTLIDRASVLDRFTQNDKV